MPVSDSESKTDKASLGATFVGRMYPRRQILVWALTPKVKRISRLGGTRALGQRCFLSPLLILEEGEGEVIRSGLWHAFRPRPSAFSKQSAPKDFRFRFGANKKLPAESPETVATAGRLSRVSGFFCCPEGAARSFLLSGICEIEKSILARVQGIGAGARCD